MFSPCLTWSWGKYGLAGEEVSGQYLVRNESLQSPTLEELNPPQPCWWGKASLPPALPSDETQTKAMPSKWKNLKQEHFNQGVGTSCLAVTVLSSSQGQYVENLLEVLCPKPLWVREHTSLDFSQQFYFSKTKINKMFLKNIFLKVKWNKKRSVFWQMTYKPETPGDSQPGG